MRSHRGCLRKAAPEWLITVTASPENVIVNIDPSTSCSESKLASPAGFDRVVVAHHVCSALIDSRDIASAKAAGVV